jgi:hypothetical protein
MSMTRCDMSKDAFETGSVKVLTFVFVDCCAQVDDAGVL